MKNNKMLCLLSYKEKLLNEIIGISIIIIINDDAGVKYDKVKFIFSEVKRFLLKSFKASLKGCKIPSKPTLFGPFRI